MLTARTVATSWRPLIVVLAVMLLCLPAIISRFARSSIKANRVSLMMSLAMRKNFCPYCYRLVPAGQRCPCRARKRRPTEGDKTRSRREPWRAHYSDPEYQRNRQAVIESQGGRCKDCGKVCAIKRDGRWTTRELGGEVDHEIPLCEGGTNEKKNLGLRCKVCHSKAETKRRQRRKRRH